MTGAALNANLNAVWCILSLITAIVLGVMAWRFIYREGLGMRTLRFQLSAALSFVCAGTTCNRAIAWLYWELRERAVMPEHPPTWQPLWTTVSMIGGLLAVFGMSLAIRALTHDRHGNRVWLAAMGAATLGVLAF